MKIPTDLVFVDTETTGLDPDRHEIFELALIGHDGDSWAEYEFWFPVSLKNAESTALRMTRFYERSLLIDGYAPDGDGVFSRENESPWRVYGESKIAERIARITANRKLVGSVPWFDAERIERRMRKAGYVPSWDYHLIDVNTLMAGAMRVNSLSSRALGTALGIDSTMFAQHTALGDARWAMACYEELVKDW